MDIALQQEQRNKGVIFKEKDEKGNTTMEMETFTKKIREHFVKKFQSSNIGKVPIYLISNWYSDRFEFSKFVQAMSSQCSTIQKEAFLYSIKIITEKIYKTKKETLQKRIVFAALSSGAAGAVPIPGTGLVDVPLIIEEIEYYKTYFDLNPQSLESANTEKLKNIVKSIASIGTRSYVLSLLATLPAKEILKSLSWFTLGVTSVVGGATSLGWTYYILTEELNKIANLSKQLLDLKLEKMIEEF